MRDDIHQRLLSASADHDNEGVRADPTAGGQGVQCGGEVPTGAAGQRRSSGALVEGGLLRRVALCGTFRVAAALS